MAYEIIGNVFKIGTTETIQTRNGQPFQRRSLTLIQRRFDPNTGKEFESNYPTIDFTRRACEDLDRFKVGDRVRVRFDVSGAKYEDKTTHETKFFNSLRGYRIEPYVAQQQPQQYQSQGYPPQGYAPQQYQSQGYPPQGYAPQPYYPPQPSGQPIPQDSQNNGLPF